MRRLACAAHVVGAWKLGVMQAVLVEICTTVMHQRCRNVCRYSYENAPIQKELQAREVGNAAAFLLSPLASAITGSLVYVDNGLNAMALATDSQALLKPEEANTK